jgi:hypothetical protein
MRQMTTVLRRRLALVAFVALAALLGIGQGASAAARTLSIYFLRGEQLSSVPRQASGVAAAVRRLLAGPTRAETAKGFRTYIPSGTQLHSVVVANGVATVDLSARFTSGADPGNRLARLAQLVRTVSAAGTSRVQLLVDGAKVSDVFPRIHTERPITFAVLRTPDVPLPPPRREKEGPPDPRVKREQQRLIQLGYLPARTADGRLGPATEEAILAFQKWERLPRSAVADTATLARLKTAQRPLPLTRGSAGKRAEVLIDRQVALLILDNRVFRAIAVSTGKPSTDTTREVPRLREDPTVVVGAVPRVAALGRALRRRDRVPRVRRRPDLSGFARLRAAAHRRGADDLRLRRGGDAGPGRRNVMTGRARPGCYNGRRWGFR